MDLEVVSAIIPSLVMVDDNTIMLTIPRNFEVREVVFKLDHSSALGSIGLLVRFIIFLRIASVLMWLVQFISFFERVFCNLASILIS